MECWGDDVPDGEITSFPMAVKCKEDETVVFSWILWPSRKARDEGMKKVMAGCGPRQGMIFSGVDTRRGEYFVDYDIFAGGSGALCDADGMDVIRIHATTANSTPAEATEQEFPLTIRCCELIPDSGGPGRFRGGLGLRIDITTWADQARISGRGMCQALPPRGLFGGGNGAVGRFVLHPGEANERRLPSVFSELSVEVGTTIRVETPSGGGFGPAAERDPERARGDVLSGKVGAQAAKRDYGLALAQDRPHDRIGPSAPRPGSANIPFDE